MSEYTPFSENPEPSLESRVDRLEKIVKGILGMKTTCPQCGRVVHELNCQRPFCGLSCRSRFV